MILTTEQVAAELSVTPGRVRQLVMEGLLEPCRRTAKPLRFRLDDVIEYQHRAMPNGRRDTLRQLSDQWLMTVRSVC